MTRRPTQMKVALSIVGLVGLGFVTGVLVWLAVHFRPAWQAWAPGWLEYGAAGATLMLLFVVVGWMAARG